MTPVSQTPEHARPLQAQAQPETARALERAVESLVRLQDATGFWCGELEGDSILESEYILMKFIVGQEGDPRLPKIGNYLRRLQRSEDGAWIQYPGAKPDLSATVKGYFALKLLGDDPEAPHMRKARELVLQLGGAERCNTFSKFYLAALGQTPYESVPTIPPEMVLLPRWSYFHLTKVSAWSRTMILPLAVVSSRRPVRPLPADAGIRELYRNVEYTSKSSLEFDSDLIGWRNLFLALDRWMKVWERTGLLPLRPRALEQIERWLLERSAPERSDGLGAIFPPMVYILIALRCLGYSADDPRVLEAERQLDRFMIEEEDAIRLQPCFSPVWDTGLAAFALTEAGLDFRDDALRRAVEWLVAKEVRSSGDWAANVRAQVEPSG